MNEDLSKRTSTKLSLDEVSSDFVLPFYSSPLQQVVPTSPWRSAQSIPKELSLKYIPYTPELSEYALVQEPVDVSPIRGDELTSSSNGTVTNGTTFDLVGNGAFDIQANFTSNSTATNATAEVHIISSDGKGVLKLGILL